jgi:hypothetical protein
MGILDEKPTIAQEQYDLSLRLKDMIYRDSANAIVFAKRRTHWLIKAAEQGHLDAQFDLGVQYAVDKDNDSAFHWFSKAAEQGSDLGQCALGTCYTEGTGVQTDKEKANFWYTKSADQGNMAAKYFLGINYYYGDGVPKDEAKAKELIASSANLGYENAQKAMKRLNAGKPPISKGGCGAWGCLTISLLVTLYSVAVALATMSDLNKGKTYDSGPFTIGLVVALVGLITSIILLKGIVSGKKTKKK